MQQQSARNSRVAFTVRLDHDTAKRCDDLVRKRGLANRNELFKQLVTEADTVRDGFENYVYDLVDRLEQHLGRQLQGVNTIVQLQLAVQDALLKYVLSTLPEVPKDLKLAAQHRGKRLYQDIMLSAVREFQRRRREDAYEPEQLGIDQEDPS